MKPRWQTTHVSDFNLNETFSGQALDARLRWLNEPSHWELFPGTGLQLWTDAPTDFWQRTHYGFRENTGHVLGAEVPGDFNMTTRVTFAPCHQYDQALFGASSILLVEPLALWSAGVLILNSFPPPELA